ncbi:hypothetical protein [Nonomuraea sp. NPDC049625]|uniref:hypothetical protein n=1 Tax=Nonomuraea sp. NPDC049625 TaxID=3155775 RepID=UPI0034137214
MIVVRGTPSVVQGEIVAGLDPEDAVHLAIDYAFEEAQARGARLWVAHGISRRAGWSRTSGPISNSSPKRGNSMFMTFCRHGRSGIPA